MNILRSELEVEEEIDDTVRGILDSYSRGIREGTDEWDILYHKHYNEETKKRRGVSLD